MNRLTIRVRKENRASQVTEQFTKLAADAVRETAESAAAEARALAPVRTGRLRASIEVVQISETEMAFGASAEYAPFVEFGSSHQAPHSFITPATINAREKLARNLTE